MGAALPPWHAHADVWTLVLALSGGYVIALRKLGPSRVARGEPVATRAQKVAFAFGVLTIWLAADWPVHDIAERSLYSVHMVQHMLLSLVAPPLLLVGTPAWLARILLRPRPLFAIARRITRPLPALLIFNTVLVFTHWPLVVNTVVGNEAWHFAAHTLLFASSIVMWWPVFSPLPELPRLSNAGRMLYLFLQSIVPTVPASFLTFGRTPLYKAYVSMPRPWHTSAITDQTVAGLIMKIAGSLLLWGIISVFFFRWYSEEQRSEGWDALQYRDVERDVRNGLARTGTNER